MSVRQVLRGGVVVDGDGPPVEADVAVVDGLVHAVGEVPALPDDVVVDCAGRLVVPGFVDAHSHVDGTLFDDDVQLALLRQGVTTAIGGQDGVSYAPGSGAYATEYFAAINGAHPAYRGSTVADLLATYDGATRLNFAYTVPAGTVRWEVMGRDTGRADAVARARMVELVRDGLADGAVGLSTGLDYVPGLFSDGEEIAAMCEPVAQAGGVHVSHMRGGYEAGSTEGVAELEAISRRTGVPVHISHFHAEADIVVALVARLRNAGVDVTFDAYPYTRGCTLLAMPLLPPELAVKPVGEVVDVLSGPAARAALRAEWFPVVAEKPSLGPDWPTMITLGHVASPQYAWAQGLTVAQAADRAGRDVVDLALDLLAASRLEVNAVMAVPYRRSSAELGRILAHDDHVGGSDGIFIGAHPHPRARGTFARYLREYVRETGVYTWQDAVDHLAARPAARFRLGRRGRVRPGWVADIAVVDPDAVADHATYDHPHALAGGIDDVLVAGVNVLAGGELTDARPGCGLRRQGSNPREPQHHR